MLNSEVTLKEDIVSYIDENIDSKSRYEIDQELLSSGYSAGNIENAWKAVEVYKVSLVKPKISKVGKFSLLGFIAASVAVPLSWPVLSKLWFPLILLDLPDLAKFFIGVGLALLVFLITRLVIAWLKEQPRHFGKEVTPIILIAILTWFWTGAQPSSRIAVGDSTVFDGSHYYVVSYTYDTYDTQTDYTVYRCATSDFFCSTYYTYKLTYFTTSTGSDADVNLRVDSQTSELQLVVNGQLQQSWK